MAAQHRLKVLQGHLRRGEFGPIPQWTAGVSGSLSRGPTKYRYTLDNGALSDEQRDFYEKNGYIVIRGLLKPAELEEFRQRFAKICRREVQVPGLTIMKDVAIAKAEFSPDERAVSKIQDFQLDPVLSRYCSLPAILRYVESFLGPNMMAMHTMLINKPPDPDLHYFPFRPPDRIVCSWTAMEKVHTQNGCLVVVPGTHQGNLLAHEYPKWEGGVNKMYHGIQNYDPSSLRVHLEMEAGDTVFFHPLLVHGSGMNRTDGFRKAISCHYASSDCEYVEVEGTTQEIIEQEVLELARRRLGSDAKISFQDVWRLRGLCVQGERKNL